MCPHSLHFTNAPRSRRELSHGTTLLISLPHPHSVSTCVTFILFVRLPYTMHTFSVLSTRLLKEPLASGYQGGFDTSLLYGRPVGLRYSRRGCILLHPLVRGSLLHPLSKGMAVFQRISCLTRTPPACVVAKHFLVNTMLGR